MPKSVNIQKFPIFSTRHIIKKVVWHFNPKLSDISFILAKKEDWQRWEACLRAFQNSVWFCPQKRIHSPKIFLFLMAENNIVYNLRGISQINLAQIIDLIEKRSQINFELVRPDEEFSFFERFWNFKISKKKLYLGPSRDDLRSDDLGVKIIPVEIFDLFRFQTFSKNECQTCHFRSNEFTEHESSSLKIIKFDQYHNFFDQVCLEFSPLGYVWGFV